MAKRTKRIGFGAGLALAACLGPSASTSEDAPTVTAIEFATGKELVFHLDPAALARHGLTPADLEWVRQVRMTDERHVVKLGDRLVSMDDLSTRVTRRDVLAPPFSVTLPDGREVFVTPDSERVARYMITGKAFEWRVRSALRHAAEADPGKTVVLSHIPVPGGQIPNYWDENHVHYSLGEPLESFGTVVVREPGQPAPGDVAGSFVLKARVGAREVLGTIGDLPRVTTSFDPRFDVELEVLEVLDGPSPYAPGDRFVLEVHSPTKTFVTPSPMGRVYELTLTPGDGGTAHCRLREVDPAAR